ncbi:MAG TPA: hypothetical protein VH598_09565 [Verrucomicrobiae bacterium]|nr:hypothetical protein [Verrucomicrobiae bacterium]
MTEGLAVLKPKWHLEMAEMESQDKAVPEVPAALAEEDSAGVGVAEVVAAGAGAALRAEGKASLHYGARSE